VCLGAIATAFGCSKPAPEPPARVATVDAATANLIDYRNGLSDSDRQTFYHLSEGSEVVPLAVLQALERARTPQDRAGEGLVAFTDNLARYGFIPDRTSTQNPAGLPVG